MKWKSVRIRTQLIAAFLMMLLLVLALGTVSYTDNLRLFQIEQTLYDHPLQVRSAIGSLKISLLNIRIGVRDFALAGTKTVRIEAERVVEVAIADAELEFDTIRSLYLGPPADVDRAFKAFVDWRTLVRDDIRMELDGAPGVISSSIGTELLQAYDRVVTEVQVIDTFATNKADQLQKDYARQVLTLQTQLLLIFVAAFLLMVLIGFALVRRIQTPLDLLTEASKNIRNGDLSARSKYDQGNEFGTLSDSFNAMAASLQGKMDLDSRKARLTGVMLSEDDARTFFRATLAELAEHTGAQMAAVYLLSTDGNTYDHFESFGLDASARTSFDAHHAEGEFGPALLTRSIHVLEHIPEDTRFTFPTAVGTLVPHGIITVPVLGAEGIFVAILTLASVKPFKERAVELIENILPTMSSRIEGILTYHRIKELKEQLTNQNRELEAQKNELSAQASELTRQNTELEVQKRQLSEASQLKTSFLSNMSHELRTPLNSVIALSGVLRRRLGKSIPKEEASYLEVIERNGKDLLVLINDILDISRIESGREEFDIETFKLDICLEETVVLLEPQAAQKGIAIICNPMTSDPSITSDFAKIRHILQNLVGNAVKFTETGTVTISAVHRGERFEITVEDTGIGISTDQIEHIFEEFRQADNSTSRRFGGTGLGLSIARKYAVLLGGSITVASTPGVGSLFTVSLPDRFDPRFSKTLPPAPPAFAPIPTRAAPIPDVGPRADGPTLLVVEDSEPAILQITDLLQETGYRVLVARDGTSALEQIGRTVPDAIVLDLMMPGVDGFSLLASLRATASTADLPVLILTAKHITKDDLKVLKRDRIHQLIQKGDVDRAELLASIRAMLEPAVAPPAAAPATAPATAAPKSRRKTLPHASDRPVILVVEDNPDNALTIRALLQDRYDLLEAADGSQAVELALRGKPALVLMDIALPGMNGIDTFHTLRNHPETKRIPIFALTASAMDNERETILSHGFDAYVSKPILADELYSRIEEVLHAR